jgi:Uncharacterised nucleotidyltransferase
MKPPPEIDLVLSGVRARYSGTTRELASAAGRRPDWSEVEEIAWQHAVTPLLHEQLSRLPDALVPADARARIRERAEANGLRNLELSAELLRLLDGLGRLGIEAVPYKGPVLAADVYGDLALREFVDLDVLIDPDHAIEAVRFLEAEGYEPYHRLTPKQERFLLRTGHDRKLIRDGRSVVELQWAIADATHVLPRDLEPLFGRTRAVSIGGREVRTLSREDLFVVLCMHGSLHFWERLAWVCDVAEAIRRWPDLDVAMVTDLANAGGTMRMVLLALGLAERLLGVRPEWLIAASASDMAAAARLADELEPVAVGTDSSEPDGRAQLRLRLAMCDRVTARGREILRLLATPSQSDWMSVGLPDPLWPAYYPIRLARLAWSYGVHRGTPGERELVSR